MGGLVKVVLFLTVILLGLQSGAIIFGIDNRSDVVFTPIINQQLAPAVAMSMGTVYRINATDQFFDIDMLLATDSLSSAALCPEERFSNQFDNWLNCTGFLVSEDILVTAGHCMIFNHSGAIPAKAEHEVTSMCADFGWVFDFKADIFGKAPIKGYSSQTQWAQCKEVIYAEISPTVADEFGVDYAIVRLDHPLAKRQSLSLSTQAVSPGDSVFTVSSPSGLPLKVADRATVSDTHFKNYYIADLDISSGSSGAPVFNQKREVTGIVVRANPGEDYVWDDKRNCNTSVVQKVVEPGMGTHVQKIEPILQKIKELKLIR